MKVRMGIWELKVEDGVEELKFRKKKKYFASSTLDVIKW